jgi:hypothetical protein
MHALLLHVSPRPTHPMTGAEQIMSIRWREECKTFDTPHDRGRADHVDKMERGVQDVRQLCVTHRCILSSAHLIWIIDGALHVRN